LNFPEDEVAALVHQIRTCDSLDDVAESILANEKSLEEDEDEDDESLFSSLPQNPGDPPTFEAELSGKMGELQVEDGAVRFIGGTSNLIFLGSEVLEEPAADLSVYEQHPEPLTSWTEVTKDTELIVHLMNMYFTWHYPYFTTLSRSLFYRDFLRGKVSNGYGRKPVYCTSLLVNAMLALGCHFTSWPAGRENPDDAASAGDHFFKEAKRLIIENDEYETPRLTTVQALALMSVREAGCGREAKGWVYSGMSFRMAYDMGLNLDSRKGTTLDEAEIDARRITFWGCFLFDK
jgi:Fungal specific transcription factor domain